MYKKVFISANVNERIRISRTFCFRWYFQIMLCCLFAIGSSDQADAKTISRTFHYERLTISRSLTANREAIYKLKAANGRELSASAMPDMVKHMQSIMNEQQTDGFKVELDGFEDRPDDAKALLFSLRNATTTSASPFFLVESSKPPSTENSSLQESIREGKEAVHKIEEIQHRHAMNEPVKGLYLVSKNGEITADKQPYSPASPNSYIYPVVISEFGKGEVIQFTVRSPTSEQLASLIDRFLALLSTVYLDIFTDQYTQRREVDSQNYVTTLINRELTSKNHVDAIRLANKQLASDLGITEEELRNIMRIEIANLQISASDWLKLSELTE